jgi:hypothetical protein
VTQILANAKLCPTQAAALAADASRGVLSQNAPITARVPKLPTGLPTVNVAKILSGRGN